MIKKYCSCVRAVQNTGKHRKEIDKFVREITDGKYYARKARMTDSVWIVDAISGFEVELCHVGWYIVATRDLKCIAISNKVFESLFEECK